MDWAKLIYETCFRILFLLMLVLFIVTEANFSSSNKTVMNTLEVLSQRANAAIQSRDKSYTFYYTTDYLMTFRGRWQQAAANPFNWAYLNTLQTRLRLASDGNGNPDNLDPLTYQYIQNIPTQLAAYSQHPLADLANNGNAVQGNSFLNSANGFNSPTAHFGYWGTAFLNEGVALKVQEPWHHIDSTTNEYQPLGVSINGGGEFQHAYYFGGTLSGLAFSPPAIFPLIPFIGATAGMMWTRISGINGINLSQVAPPSSGPFYQGLTRPGGNSFSPGQQLDSDERFVMTHSMIVTGYQVLKLSFSNLRQVEGNPL